MWTVGSEKITIGSNAQSTGHGISIGPDTDSKNGVAIAQAAVSDDNSISIGRSADGNTSSVCIGPNSKGSHQDISIGEDSTAAWRSVAIGQRATAGGGNSVGAGSRTHEGNTLGTDSLSEHNSIAIGNGAKVSGLQSVLLNNRWTAMSVTRNNVVKVGEIGQYPTSGLPLSYDIESCEFHVRLNGGVYSTSNYGNAPTIDTRAALMALDVRQTDDNFNVGTHDPETDAYTAPVLYDPVAANNDGINNHYLFIHANKAYTNPKTHSLSAIIDHGKSGIAPLGIKTDSLVALLVKEVQDLRREFDAAHP